MDKDQYTVLTDKVDSIQNSVDIIDKDLSKDRQDIQQLVIRVSTLEAQIDEMRKLMDRIPQKTQDKVAEAIEPTRQEAQDLKETIDKKKTIILPEKKQIQWWKFWKKGG